MIDLPRLALAVRQPWAWAIIHAGKDIENRSPKAVSFMTYRGRIAILASKTMTREEYRSAALFMKNIGVECPPAADLVRGAVIGTVEVVDMVRECSSPWWIGPRGLVLKGAEPCAPIPAGGLLGFFEWRRSDGEVREPAQWMRPKAPIPFTDPSPAVGDMLAVLERLHVDPDAA
jgi:hypothetical protein